MFQIVWPQTSLDELATIWMQADSATRSAITRATVAIDQTLQAHPQDQGESREEDERVLFVSPLGISFTVDPEQATVTILHIWDIRRK